MKVEKITTKTEELEITRATLLSTEEIEKLPIELREYSREWWSRSIGANQIYAASVYYDGSVNDEGYNVNYTFNCIRPALIIKNLGSSAFQIGDRFILGGKKFKVINEVTAFCLEDIGTCAFREDWRADDANDYEKSDIKKFIDDWFDKVRKNND